MRRHDKEMTDRAQIDSVIARSQVCRIALCNGSMPYIVPMCFGYDGKNLYFHSAKEGRKINILKCNSAVCFAFDADCEVKKSDKPCSFSMKYRSVIGFGKASFLEDVESKRKALQIIMKQYDETRFSFPDEALGNIAVIMIEITEITAKKSGF